MDNSVSLTKEEKQWNKSLNHHIERYSNLRDWSELAAWLNKLKNHLTQYKGHVLDKNILLKKLATSLSPALPVALHELTLQIYAILFQNIISIDCLELTCLGLFTFYTNANIKNKQKIIQIFFTYFPAFGNELKILSSGLIITILPSYIEMNESLAKDISSFLELLSTKQLLGEKMMIEAIWIAIFRSPECRVAGLKFLSSKMGKGDQQDQHDQQDTFWDDTVVPVSKYEEVIEDINSPTAEIPNFKEQHSKNHKQLVLKYCPHLETVVTNALITCISDKNVLVVKGALDFLYKYLPLKTQIISNQVKSKLTYSILWLCAKRDMSINRKINLWLFGKPDAQNKYTIQQKNVEFLVNALIKYLDNDTTIQALKIIFNLFSQHDDLPLLLLNDISKNLIQYCVKLEANPEIIKLMHRLIDRIQSQIFIFSESLGKQLLNCIQEQQFREAQRILQLMFYFMCPILKPEQLKKMLFPMLKIIIESYFITNWKDLNYMKSAINQALEMIQRWKQIFISLIGSQQQVLKDSNNIRRGSEEIKQLKRSGQFINKQSKKEKLISFKEQKIFFQHINLYQNLVQIIQNEKNHQNSRFFQEELVCINKMQLKLYEIFDVFSQKWVPILIKVVYLSYPQYFLAAIEVIGQTLQRDGRLKKQLMRRTQQNQIQNFLQTSIHKIWGILSLGHLQTRIIPLLLRLTKYYPHYFQMILERQFKINNQLSIIKFSLLWNLAPKYTNIISHQQLQDTCKPGLFRMLNYLDNGNPLVKYNSNIWINQCFPFFHRVLNPLLQIMLKPNQFWYRTFQGQYIFVIPPQQEKIIQVLTHIRSIVKHTSEKFYKFSVKPLTSDIQPYYQIFQGHNNINLNVKNAEKNYSDFNQSRISNETSDKKKQQSFQNQQIYINAIFDIVVRFTGSKYIAIQNPGIDLAACQTLQVLIRNISSHELCMHVMQNHLKNILKSLHFATVNSQHLLQIQLLNLLKIIFFQSNLRKTSSQKVHKFMKHIISSSLFTKTILQGLDSAFPYIKERFVQFINMSIVLILQYHTNSSQMISSIFNTYSNKISFINSKKMEITNKKDLEISKINTQILILFNGIKQLMSYFLNMQIKQFQKEKNQNDADLGVFSLYSYKSFVSLKVQKKQLETTKSKKIGQEISKQISAELPQLLLTITSCWTVSQLLPFYKLSMEGLSLFESEEFHNYNKQLYLTLGKFQVQESVQNFVINLIRVLLNKYSKQVMNAMIQTWSSANVIDLKLKIIQILNLSSIPIENFYNIMSECILVDRINKKKKPNIIMFQSSNHNIQQQILHFCQAFTHYNFQNFSVFQAANLINVWLSFLKFIKLFQNARNVQTIFAVLELVDLFMKKNNPKEIMRDERIKKQFQTILNNLNELFAICSGKLKINCESKQKVHFKQFLPMPSTIFDNYLNQTSKKQDAKLQYLCFQQISTQKCQKYLRIHAFLIVKRMGFNILSSFFTDDVGIVKKIRQFIHGIVPIIEDKNLDSVLIQNASQVLLSILQKKIIFLKEFKSDILQIFNKDDFFICSSKTLHCWVKIIDMIIDNNKDHQIFNEYLDKVSLVSSIFSSYTFQTKKKIKSFERICFILYAGSKDKYTEKAHLLIDKIIDVIKNSDAPQPVLILIFFCLRILILRMSPEKLSKLFSNLWQMIMFLLVNIFKDSIKQNSKLNLVWAALKLIQMISIMEMGEFHQHQWMFFYDFIGLSFKTSDKEIPYFSTPKKKSSMNEVPMVETRDLKLPQRLSEKSIKAEQKSQPKQIKHQKFQISQKPMIWGFLPSGCQVYQSEVEHIQQKRHLIIKQDKIDDIELLNTKAMLLSGYLINNNQHKMVFQMKQIEALIENDFLNLDEFIFKFK